MRVWVDMLTPKQVLFFSRLIERLKEAYGEGSVLATIRNFRETVAMARIRGLRVVNVGWYGGATLYGKLEASIERMRVLLPIVNEFQPDVAISFTSPDAARISFGLGVPHVSVSDAPHSFAASLLSIPLSKLHVSSSYIPRRVWLKYGITVDRIVTYRALDPWAWLINFSPNPKVAERLGLSPGDLTIVMRPEESKSSYIPGMRSVLSTEAAEAMRSVVEGWGARLIIVPRYESDIPVLRKLYGDFAEIIEKPVDAASLLSYTKLFIGGGGTMSVEAILLGVPTISVYPSQWVIEKFLVRRRLLVKTTPKSLAAEVEKILRNYDATMKRFLRKVEKLKAEMEDPIPVLHRALTMATHAQNNSRNPHQNRPDEPSQSK